ncbi:MAG: alpha-glucuronidase family glycosyl hydrolase [Draconibacterium sp.]
MRIKTIAIKVAFLFVLAFLIWACSKAPELKNQDQDGSKLWFANYTLHAQSDNYHPQKICIVQTSPTFSIAESELKQGIDLLFNQTTEIVKTPAKETIVAGTTDLPFIAEHTDTDTVKNLGKEGFIIQYLPELEITIIAANTENGVLYGTYHYLRLLRTNVYSCTQSVTVEKPAYKRRILNHWDNLDGTIERGYAGHSIWLWDALPEKLNPRIVEYARANASIGINGTVLNNVNANPAILTTEYLHKTKIIADALRPYGMRVYLSVNFSSPKILGNLPNSDPLNPEVKAWWKSKAQEIYELIPDFGGLLVKANSEGQPGPQDYGRTHADGANMLADVLAPFGGIVMWRAFVYSPSGDDRAKQAYNEFKPLDGQFKTNVLIQVKNGPIDFQPCEPFSPLFGAMEHTTLMPEVQITKEYLGFADHLVYLGTLFSEFLQSDTYQKGINTTVARVTNGSVFNDRYTGIAGVANIGLDTNWCGHQFAPANWYVFGRLAWNPDLPAETIAREWLEQTFSHETAFVDTMTTVMMKSREAVVNYMTPLGLHHLMGWSHHYGPEPWCNIPGARPDWLPSYYHRADSVGIGFDRSSSGSNAVAQYAEPLHSEFDNAATCPDKYLLWFHHIPWNYKMKSGRDLWTELCYKYSDGVKQTMQFGHSWQNMKAFVDQKRFNEVATQLKIQEKEARWWRDACLLYFQTFSIREIPAELELPTHNLEELKKLKFDLKNHN